MSEIKKEKIPIGLIYKQDDSLAIEFTRDLDNDFEIYGFLKVIVNKMEERLLKDIGGLQ